MFCVCCVFKIFGGCLQDFWWVSSRFLGLSPGPSAGPPLPWTALNFVLFLLFPAGNFVLFFPSLGVFSLNFGGVFEFRDPQMCTIGLSGCHVKSRRLRGRRGFTRQPEISKRAHLTPPALQTPPKFHEKSPEKDKKSEHGAGEGKNAKFWAVRRRDVQGRGSGAGVTRNAHGNEKISVHAPRSSSGCRIGRWTCKRRSREAVRQRWPECRVWWSNAICPSPKEVGSAMQRQSMGTGAVQWERQAQDHRNLCCGVEALSLFLPFGIWFPESNSLRCPQLDGDQEPLLPREVRSQFQSEATPGHVEVQLSRRGIGARWGFTR